MNQSINQSKEDFAWIKNLEIGDVILLDKENPGFGGFLLQHASSGPKATHIIIITKITSAGEVFFSHATGHFFSNPRKSGVEKNVPLVPYLDKNPSKLMLLKPSKKLRTTAKDALNGIANKDYKYNYFAAFLTIFYFPQLTKEKVNCGSYVAKIFGLSEESLTLPISWLYHEEFSLWKF